MPILRLFQTTDHLVRPMASIALYLPHSGLGFPHLALDGGPPHIHNAQVRELVAVVRVRADRDGRDVLLKAGLQVKMPQIPGQDPGVLNHQELFMFSTELCNFMSP